MKENSLPSWSSEEERLLRHEAFMAEALKQRASIGAGEQPKPWWQHILWSSGGTALITVLLGGIAGGLINWFVQSDLKDREFWQAYWRARGDQALVAYKEYLDQEREIVKRAYELIGSAISGSEDLITLTSSDFALDGFVGADRQMVKEQRVSFRDKYNTVDAQWRSEHEKLALLMSYYHHGRREVVAAWQEAQQSVTEYMDCARRWHADHVRASVDKNTIKGACKAEKDNLAKKVEQLTTRLEASRQYAWTGWESPDKLRSAQKKE